jgi:hypothetical protein
MRKIKDLSLGDARIRGRGFSSAEMVDAEWTSLIVIACNESNFPSIDASDRPLIRRMKALKMRSLFVPPDELGEHAEEEHVYAQVGEGFKRALKVEHRSAHFLVLAEAYRRGALAEPECVREMVDKILAFFWAAYTEQHRVASGFPRNPKPLYQNNGGVRVHVNLAATLQRLDSRASPPPALHRAPQQPLPLRQALPPLPTRPVPGMEARDELLLRHVRIVLFAASLLGARRGEIQGRVDELQRRQDPPVRRLLFVFFGDEPGEM